MFSSLCSKFVLNLYIVYELNTCPRDPTNNLTLKYCGALKLTRNSNRSKFTFNGRGIAFDGKGFQSFDNDTARNVTIFGVNISSSSPVDNPKNDFLVWAKDQLKVLMAVFGADENQY